MAISITNIAVHLPHNILSNDDLALQFGRWEPEKIEAKIGIRERRIAGKDETA
jgi:3-oxoacyl-[acyl-carrier-protein] synthase-3